MDKRKMLREIRKRWDNPEKLFQYLIDLDKQEEVNREILRKNVMKETAENYSIALADFIFNRYGYYNELFIAFFLKNFLKHC